MLQKIWDFCGEVRVNFWLLLLISLNLGIGSYYLKFNYTLFNPLNHLLIQEWVQKLGRENPGQAWWLATLLLLLVFLGVNTLVCALKRLIQLWPFRRQIGLKTFSIRVSPSFIHLCFLAILGGHLISLIVGYNGVIPAKPGSTADLPGSWKGPGSQPGLSTLSRSRPVVREDQTVFGPHALRDRRAFGSPGTPDHAAGFPGGKTFHLDLARGANPEPELKIIIKEDPGRRFIFWGFAVLIVFMLWYFPQRKST